MRSLKTRLWAGVIAGSVAVSTVGVTETGCGWWSQGGGAQQAQNDGINVASCVLEAAMTGNLTLAGLAATCVGVAIGDILNAAESLIAYYTATPEAGPPAPDAGPVVVTAQSVYCGDTAKKPYPWAPVCVDAGVLANLRAARSNVLAARAGAK